MTGELYSSTESQYIPIFIPIRHFFHSLPLALLLTRIYHNHNHTLPLRPLYLRTLAAKRMFYTDNSCTTVQWMTHGCRTVSCDSWWRWHREKGMFSMSLSCLQLSPVLYIDLSEILRMIHKKKEIANIIQISPSRKVDFTLSFSSCCWSCLLWLYVRFHPSDHSWVSDCC